MADDLPVIASFWTGAPLSVLERTCLKSFADHGHRTVLFSYGPVEGVPPGVETADAAEILPEPETVLTHAKTQSPAPYADKFRYHLLRERPGWVWVDTDAYCWKPFRPVDGYLFGYSDEKEELVANGVLALPPDSPTLAELIEWTSNEYAILPWMPPRITYVACKLHRDGEPMHVSKYPWGAWGPQMLTYLLRRNREIGRATPHPVLYPMTYSERRRYFKPARLTLRAIRDETVSIHFYGRRVRDRLLKECGGVPPAGTILYQLAERHGLLSDEMRATEEAMRTERAEATAARRARRRANRGDAEAEAPEPEAPDAPGPDDAASDAA